MELFLSDAVVNNNNSGGKLFDDRKTAITIIEDITLFHNKS